MARFIVLKGQTNYAVLDFDGNLGRVGSGANVDLRLEGGQTEEDFFFLSKSGSGEYRIEPRSADIKITVNGSPISAPTALGEGAKINLLDYLILVTYQGADQPEESVAPEEPEAPPKVEPPQATTPEPAPPDRTEPVSTGTTPEKPQQAPSPEPPQSGEMTRPSAPAAAPPKAAPSPPPKPAPTPPPPPPPPKAAGADDATVRINFDEAAPSITPQRKEPVVEEVKGGIEPVYSLVCLTGQHKGKVFRIDSEEFVIGRDREASIMIDHDEKGRPDTSVSRTHCTLTTDDESLYIVDKSSKLRTFVNGEVLEPGQREHIAPEDLISIPSPQGQIMFRLCFVDEENFAPAEAKNTTLWLILGLVVVIILLVAAWVFFL